MAGAAQKPISMLVWLLVIGAMEIFALAAIVPTSALSESGLSEMKEITELLGKDTSRSIRERSDQIFEDAFNKSGVMQKSFDLFVPTKHEKANSRGMESMGAREFGYFKERLMALWMAIYLAIFRMVSIVAWVPGFIPFILAAGWDGAAIRKVKSALLVPPSARHYGIAKTIIGGIFVAPILVALFPGAISPMIAPVMCLTAAVAAYWYFANSRT